MSTKEYQPKQIAYTVVALTSFFFLSWAAADIVSAGVNLVLLRYPATVVATRTPQSEPVTPEGGYTDIYRQMVLDRVVDSGARLVIAGAVFFLARRRLRSLREPT